MKNICKNRKKQNLEVTKKYNPSDYQTYENYNAINVNKVSDIPYDYYGIMGVPITFLDYWNPKQFIILGRSGDIKWAKNDCYFFTPPPTQKQIEYKKKYPNYRVQNSYLVLPDGKLKFIYYRVFIKRKVKGHRDDVFF